MTTNISELLQDVRVRYRNALLAKAGVLATLSAGAAAGLAWRLHALRWHPTLGIGIPAALALTAAAAIAIWVRRRWISRRGVAGRLDRALGLEQRLVTAAEFAVLAPPPALYPLLVSDTAQRFSADQVRLPRPLDRAAAALFIALLLLLCWPGRGSVPLRLARLPSPTPPPPPQAMPPPPTPPESPPAQQPQDSPRQDRKEQGQSGSSAQQPRSSAQQGSSQQTEQGGQRGEARGRGSEEGARDGTQAAAQRKGQGPSQDGAQRLAEGTRTARERKSQAAERSSGAQRSGGRQASSHEQQQQGAGNTAQSSSRSTGQSRGGSGSQQGTQRASSAQSSVGQDALKAEIQALLKEVSGELAQMQAQLATAKDLPRPEAGTSTDPELYGSDSTPPADQQANGAALPMQLKTDPAAAKSHRRGGGVGRPSGEVSHESPEAQPEAAQLSEEPLEETPVTRQPVPPEYRSVFDRLHHPAAKEQPTTP